MDSRHWDIENEIRNRKPYNEKTYFGKQIT
jgi:hypothetical protein